MFDSPLKLAALMVGILTLWRMARNRSFNRAYRTLPIAQRRLTPRRWL